MKMETIILNIVKKNLIKTANLFINAIGKTVLFLLFLFFFHTESKAQNRDGVTINGPQLVCSNSDGETYSVTGFSIGDEIEWSIEGTGGSINGANNQSTVLVIWTNTGSSNLSPKVKVTVTSESGTQIDDHDITLFPNTQITIDTNTECSLFVGNNGQYSITAVGGDDLSYEWYEKAPERADFTKIITSNNFYIEGTWTTNTLKFKPLNTEYNGYEYYCIVHSNCGTDATSSTKTLNIYTPPDITSDPDPIAVCENSEATFSIQAQGDSISYQWIQIDKNNNEVEINDNIQFSGSTTDSLTIHNTPYSLDQFKYKCRVTSQPNDTLQRSRTSSPATLTVHLFPEEPNPITWPESPCIGSTVTYSVNEVLDVTYTWTFPEDWIPVEPKNSSSVTVTVGTNDGSVSVTPTLGECDGESYQSDVTVSPTPVEPTPDDWPESPCIGSTVTYSVNEVLDVTYTWTFPEDWIPIEPKNSSSVTVTVGTNDGSVSVTPTLGECDGESYTSVVTVSLPPPQPTPVSFPQSPIAGDTISYSVQNITGVTFHWGVPDSWEIVSGQDSFILTVRVGTNEGEVSVYATNDCGNGDKYELQITPRILQASIEAHMNKLTYCVNERVNITSSIAGINSSDYFTYKWFFNDIEQNTYTDRLEFNASESGIIKLLINGFLFSNSISITVNPLPNLNLANDYASYCKNQKGLLLHVTEPDPELTYTWTPGEGIDAWSDTTKPYLIVNFAKSPYGIPAQASVKAKNAFGCEASATFLTQLNSVSETLPDTLQWKKKGDHILVFNPDPLLKEKSWGWGYTSLSDFSDKEIKEADSLNYHDFYPTVVSNPGTLFWVEVISSVKDACNARYYYNVPMQFKYSLPEETPEHPLKVFPNPATGLVYLDPGPVENSEGELQYQVYDMRGTLLKSGKLNPHPGSPVLIDLSAFPTGLYLLRVFNDKGFAGNSRIIIAK